MQKDNVGLLRISEDVVIKIAASAVNEIKGVEAIKSDRGIIKKIFTRDDPIRIKIFGDVIELSVDVVVKYGCNVISVCEKIQEAVKSSVQETTGITVSKVNITVSGISFEKK